MRVVVDGTCTHNRRPALQCELDRHDNGRRCDPADGKARPGRRQSKSRRNWWRCLLCRTPQRPWCLLHPPGCGAGGVPPNKTTPHNDVFVANIVAAHTRTHTHTGMGNVCEHTLAYGRPSSLEHEKVQQNQRSNHGDAAKHNWGRARGTTVLACGEVWCERENRW